MKARIDRLKQGLAIILMAFACFAMTSCGDVSCSCMVSYMPNSFVQGYGYKATVTADNEAQCERADKDIWDDEMKTLVNTLTQADVDYEVFCTTI